MKKKKWGKIIGIFAGVVAVLYLLFLLGNTIYTQYVIENQVAPKTYQIIKKHVVMKKPNAWLREHHDIAGKHSGVNDLDLLNGVVSDANPHSNISTNDQFDQQTTNDVPTVKQVHGVTWINMPTDLFDLDGKTSKEYIRVTNQAINNAKRGVVLDLQDHHGGEVTTMLLSVAPLLKNGRVFSGMDNKNKVYPYYLAPHKLAGGIPDSLNPGQVKQVSQVKRPKLKVAILTNKYTASAAEIATIALRDNPKTKIVGQSTFGDTSINSGDEEDYLTFSTIFIYTVGWIVGNDGHVYKNQPIKPDFPAKTQKQIDQAVEQIMR